MTSISEQSLNMENPPLKPTRHQKILRQRKCGKARISAREAKSICLILKRLSKDAEKAAALRAAAIAADTRNHTRIDQKHNLLQVNIVAGSEEIN